MRGGLLYMCVCAYIHVHVHVRILSRNISLMIWIINTSILNLCTMTIRCLVELASTACNHRSGGQAVLQAHCSDEQNGCQMRNTCVIVICVHVHVGGGGQGVGVEAVVVLLIVTVATPPVPRPLPKLKIGVDVNAFMGTLWVGSVTT